MISLILLNLHTEEKKLMDTRYAQPLALGKWIIFPDIYGSILILLTTIFSQFLMTLIII
jgi:hypothetical protein